MNYKPEGCLYRTAENQKYISTPEGLAEAMEKGVILEARACVCTGEHDLIIDLPCAKGIIKREEGAVGIAEGKTRDIAIISRVNKTVCFKVMKLSSDGDGRLTAYLSRRAAQEECAGNYINILSAGDVIDARITHLEQFGAFVDIGCGLPSLIPIDAISVSRISHPSDRFTTGQFIKAVVTSNENSRICLTHKELLGTWEENISLFHTGETVSGIVRSVEDYGVFVELAPNLAGLAELKEDVHAGLGVSVYIKAIIPEKMKIKLIIVDTCPDFEPNREFEYYFTENHMDRWIYTPESSDKLIETNFVNS
ncbi:MAG: S1 RNA-binding domain-containing protein [Ruminococcus sp.]|nr:S1 RNA-binding domain-containing protein [Ruminococcus sp.]